MCYKTFLLKWRLRKHMKEHEDLNKKCCHYFSNNKICNFEEIAGCMFKHEAAPLCKNSNKCKVSKCQFSHTSHDKEKHYAQSDDDNELIEEDDNQEDDLIEEPDCGNCKVINNFVKHTND